MADDKRSVIATQKPIVEESCNNVLSSASGVAKRNSNSGGGDTSGVNARSDKQRKHQRQESREENSSTDTSLSVSGTSSPAKGNRSSNKERRPNSGFKSGRQGKGGGGGAKEQGTRKGALDAETEGPERGPGTQQGQEAASAPKNRGNKSKFSARKRAPPKEDYEIKPNDVFVNEKSNFVAQLSKCKKLFEKGHKEIYLHGLGKAIPRAINVALELKKFYHETVDYTVNTSTVQLCDDVVDLENPDQPAIVRTRNVSSIDIKVFRSLNIP